MRVMCGGESLQTVLPQLCVISYTSGIRLVARLADVVKRVERTALSSGNAHHASLEASTGSGFLVRQKACY